jgi:thiamine pyrophosphate-dependent acetolactate synthase large subunit-like protein
MQPTMRDAGFDALDHVPIGVVALALTPRLLRESPTLDAIDIADMAHAQRCDARRVETHGELLDALECGDRTAPLLLEVVVERDEAF